MRCRSGGRLGARLKQHTRHGGQIGRWTVAEALQDPQQDGASIPPERLAAMGAVRNIAVQRVGDRSGFDCLLCFLTWEQLGQADPGLAWSQFLEPSELGQRFAARYGSPAAKRQLTVFLLDRTVQMHDEDAIALATRILRRMRVVGADGAFVRPLLFLGSNDHGVAAAIAVYDEFWTESW